MNRARVCALVALVATGLLVGCESDSDPDSPKAAPLPSDVLAGDPARAQAAVLLSGDLPPGWTEEAPDESDDPRKELGSCGEMLRAEETGRTAEGSSNRFSREQTGVSEEVWLYESDGAAAAAFEGYFSEASRRCIEDAVAAAALEGAQQDPSVGPQAQVAAEVGDLSVERVGDDSAGWGAVVTLGARGVSLPAYADVIVVRVGRVLLEFSFLSFLQPFDGPRSDVLGHGVERASRALAS